MALELEQTLYNADVVRYHRVIEVEIDELGALSVAFLGSFRSREQREMPIPPVMLRKFPFIRSGDANTVLPEAYDAIKALPEWAGAIDV